MDTGIFRQFPIDKMENEATYIAELFHQFDIKREFCIHCRVKKVDAEKNTVDLEQLPDHTRTVNGKEEKIERETLYSVPILCYAHGGFIINSPIFVGDTGYVIAADRCCKSIQKRNSSILYKDDSGKANNKGSEKPNNYSLTMYQNGFFIPSSWAEMKLEDDEKGCFVIKGIGKQDGDDKWCRVVLTNDGNISAEVDEHGVEIDNKDGVSAWRKLTVVGDSREAVIDPLDLVETDAKFREVTVLTGFKEKVGNVAKFFASKMRVLADEPVDAPIVDVEVGGGGGGGGDVSDVSISSPNGTLSVIKNITSGVISFVLDVVLEKKIKWGNETLANFSADADVLLPKNTLSFVDGNNTTSISLVSDNGMTIRQKNLVAGEGINLVSNQNDITISADGSELTAGPAITVQSASVGVITDSAKQDSTKTIEASGLGVGELRLFGSLNVQSNLLDTVSDTLTGKSLSGPEYVVTLKNGRVYYKSIGELAISAEQNSGLSVIQNSTGGHSLVVDWANRPQSTSISLHSVHTTDDTGVDNVVTVPSSGDINIEHYIAGRGIDISGSGNLRTISLQNEDGAIRTIAAGDNVSVSRSGDTVTISAETEESSPGYESDITFVSSVTYSNHRIIAHRMKLVMQNGRIMNVVAVGDQTIEAVQETVP